MVNVKNMKKTILVLFSFCLLIGATNFINTVQAEDTPVTVIDEGFEDDIPSEWNNTGWVLNWYGFPYTGSNWISASAAGAKLEIPDLTLGNNTQLIFWYAVEENGSSMSMEVIVNSNVVWSETFSNRNYDQAIIDLGDFNSSQNQNVIFNCTTSELFVENIDDIKITTELPEEDTQNSNNTNNGDSDTPADNETKDDAGDSGDDSEDTNGGDIPVTPQNKPPIADVSLGEPYLGIIGEPILFNGSASKDSNGEILSWQWDFGDGTTGKGETVSHSFDNSGTFNVTLTVTDTEGAQGSTTTQVAIGQGNLPPTQPEVKLPSMPLELNESSQFYARSMDFDNEMIQYMFNWDDGTSNTSEFVINNTKVGVNHSWSSAGLYEIKVYAKDESNNPSATTTELVLVDVTALSIDEGEIKGSLLDYQRNNVFDVFYNEATGEEIPLESTDDQTYLIDTDEDGNWDYTYYLKGGLSAYEESSSDDGDDADPNQSEESTDTPGFEIIILGLALIILFVIKKRKI